MFSQAIVRKPCTNLVYGLTSAALGTPDFDLAVAQHQRYVEALEACGLKVTVLPADEEFADSTFVEDTAVLLKGFAVLCNPGAPSRRAEAARIRAVLEKSFPNLVVIAGDGYLDGGDVMTIGQRLFIGLSARTNAKGAAQLIEAARASGYSAVTVELKSMLHLKTGVNYLDRNSLLVTGEFIGRSVFNSYDCIVVPPREAYAANSLWINGRVLVPAGCPETLRLIQKRGFETQVLDVSEFRKLDGGLSCLSLRF